MGDTHDCGRVKLAVAVDDTTQPETPPQAEKRSFWQRLFNR
jgi:hypothetical protein